MNSALEYEEVLRILIDCSIKGSLLLLAAWAASSGLRRASASLRHHIWAAAIVGLLALPMVIALMPSWVPNSLHQTAPVWLIQSGFLVEAPSPIAPGIGVDASLDVPWRDWVFPLLLSAWVLGFLAMSCRLAAGVVRIRRLLAAGEPLFRYSSVRLWQSLAQNHRFPLEIELLRSSQSCMPLTWGMLRPRVLLPREVSDWPEDRLRSVLAHELAHVTRRDWFCQILAEGCRAIFWFHPLVWLACARMRRESELACDDAALESGIEGSIYAEHLLDIARSFSVPNRALVAALAMARPTNLERRFISMLSTSVDRSALTRKAALCTTVCAMILVGALAAVGGQATAMSGKFFGTVYDASGGVIPNATVIVANPVARTKDMTTTSAAGGFEFPGLPVGEYTLEVLASGFMRHLQSGVVLEPGQSRSERITLKVGMVSERIEVVGEGTPASSQADTSKPRERIRVGGNVQATKLVKMERPTYPLIAKSAGIQGTVLLEGVIGQDGSVQNLRVLNSQIDPDLAKAAVEAVSKWVYQPTLLNGKPVEIITQITINFTLAK